MLIFISLAAIDLSWGTWGLHWVQTLVVAHGLSCSMACGVLVHLPGIESAASALQDGFLTTGRPGKSLSILFKVGTQFNT